MCTITIAIPVYNAEKYIKDTLLSALNQVFTESYEILIIDDCGTDNSLNIIKEISQSHEKGFIIRIVKHSQNLGIGDASNTAIAEARGKYLFFLDSDDYITPNCLSTLYGYAIRYSLEITVGSMKNIWSSKKESPNVYHDRVVSAPSAGLVLFAEGLHIYSSRWNKLINVDFLRRNGIRCYQKVYEDNFFCFQLACFSNSFGIFHDITYHYVQQSDSIITSTKRRKPDVSVFSSIILDAKEIVSMFATVKGIYDYYLTLVRWSFSFFLKTDFSKKDYFELCNRTNGFLGIIPSSNRILFRRNKLFYYLHINSLFSFCPYYYILHFLNKIRVSF